MDNMQKFEMYKNEWNFPIYTQNLHTPPRTAFVGKCVTFQEAIKLTLITGQCFGLNPVRGIRETDATKLRFTFRSWRFVYTIVSIVIQIAAVLLCLVKMLKDNESSLDSNASTIFHLTTCATTIIFLRMAMKWPTLCVHISKTETADPNMDVKLTRKCNIICVVILSLALIEHTLADISGIAVAVDCFSDKNVFDAFLIQSFPWLWSFFSYNPFLGVFTLALNIQSTFNWNFADLFVICMSVYLTSRLDQLNNRIDAVKDKYVSSSFWRTMREDYNRVTNLVRVVDETIGGVVLISFVNNLFFVCLQLLHILQGGIQATSRCQAPDEPDLRPFGGYEHAVYFIYSFSFLVARSLAVSLAASKVHSASKEPRRALYDVSSATYCVEIQRFLDQVHGDSVALSGLQFFNVKRGLVLSVAGTIVTYELVLMQFTGETPTPAPP